MTTEIHNIASAVPMRIPRRRLLARDLAIWRDRLAAWLASDLATPAVWTPVAMGVGAGIYFGLGTEPPFALGLVAFFAALMVLVVSPKFRLAGGAFLLAALGFVAADWRAQSVSAPILKREIGISAISGRVVSVERSPDRERIVLAVDTIARLDAAETPARIRLTWRGEASDVVAGDPVELRAGLSPPPPPAAPGSFDFARQLYFQRIGAVGFAVTRPEGTAKRGQNSIRMRIENLRARLTERITTAAPGQGGAIVAAVVTGKREAIAENSRAALRDAGLAHLLAISGLHMGLATGLIFFAVRGALALVEPIAIRFPIKKWAAAAALLSGFAYLLLSGGAWSPRRAFIMTAIMFVAILVDRRAFSLRNIAIAATIILLTTPEALFHPGFQMSFAAATALIACYELWNRLADPARDFSIGARLKRYAIGVVVTDLVASLATAPFALYHFNRVAIFSLPANVLAMPLMAFWIMPAAVIGLMLAPFGLDGPAWVIAARGMDIILAIGAEVSSWPGAVSLTPQWPVAALIAIVSGGIWFCLTRSPLRFAGAIGLPIAAMIAAWAPTADIFVSSTSKNVGIVTNGSDGSAVIPFNKRREKFALRVWNESIGADPYAERVQIAEIGSCGEAGCIVGVKEKTVSVLRSREMLAEDCARADLVIAMFPVRGRDRGACRADLIDWYSAWDNGAHAVRIEYDSIEVTSVADFRGERPWSGSPD